MTGIEMTRYTLQNFWGLENGEEVWRNRAFGGNYSFLSLELAREAASGLAHAIGNGARVRIVAIKTRVAEETTLVIEKKTKRGSK